MLAVNTAITGRKDMEKKLFEELSAINVNDHKEEKNGLSYLSWAWAWSEFMKVCPEASYKIKTFDGKPYLFDEKLGYMVFTSITVGDDTKDMWLPVMNETNKAMKDHPYKYLIKRRNKHTGLEEMIEKTCEAATMFDINKTIMRCLVKNISMFGLGLYIYAGEDLPEEEPKEISIPDLCEGIKKVYTEDQIQQILEHYKADNLEAIDRSILEKYYAKNG